MSKIVGLTELAAALARHIMTTAEKTKLAGVAEGANNYSLPTAAAGTLGGVKVGTNLSIDANGVLSARDTTYNNASSSEAGLMSAADKAKLDTASTDYSDTGSNTLTTAKALRDAYNALAALISANLVYTVAQTCPAVGDAADNTVYLVPDAGGATCTEYLKVTVGGTARMEVIGSTGITVDSVIRSGGANPVTGGAIYTALEEKQDALTSNDYATQAEIAAAFGV